MIQYKPWSNEIVNEMIHDVCDGVFSCLDIGVSGKCSYNCMYCETPYRDKVSSLNLDKVCAFLDTKQFKWVYFCGIGEPTYECNEQQLLRVLESCEKNNTKCSIFTNLSNLSEKLIEYIKNGTLYCIFKFDSQSKDIVRKLYNPSNTDLDTHLKNIKIIDSFVIADEITTNIAASIVPTKYNIDEIPELVQWCVDRNIFPLVAQLEYAGAAKNVYEELSLDDEILYQLKQKIEAILGEEYKVPFCPAVFSGLHITCDNKITIDSRTGLSCHSFWLTDPLPYVVCNNIDELLTIEDITSRMLDKRTEFYENFIKHRNQYEYYIFGGCGGNKKEIFELYEKAMEKNFESHPSNENYLKINRFTYLDNNATTRISDSVNKAMIPYLSSLDSNFANPNSKTTIGHAARNAINNAREQIANTLKANSNEIYFTSSGSESNSWAIKCCLKQNTDMNKRIILSTEIEHESVLDYLKILADKEYEIVNIPLTTNGAIDIISFQKNFTQWDKVAFATIMLVNNETGVINDIKSLASIIQKYKIPFHCDAVQALGKIRVNVYDLGVNYLSLSGHKIHAPKGVGALFVKQNSYLSPLVYGSQESGKRGGTENVAFIVALGQAIEDVYSDNNTTFEERINHMSEYRDKIENSLLDKGYTVYINGKGENRVANTINVGFEGVDALALSFRLESRGIYVSNGAACNSQNPIHSHVLRAMHSPAYEKGAIRISLSEYTETIDVDYFIANLHESIKRLKEK